MFAIETGGPLDNVHIKNKSKQTNNKKMDVVAGAGKLMLENWRQAEP